MQHLLFCSDRYIIWRHFLLDWDVGLVGRLPFSLLLIRTVSYESLIGKIVPIMPIPIDCFMRKANVAENSPRNLLCRFLFLPSGSIAICLLRLVSHAGSILLVVLAKKCEIRFLERWKCHTVPDAMNAFVFSSNWILPMEYWLSSLSQYFTFHATIFLLLKTT